MPALPLQLTAIYTGLLVLLGVFLGIMVTRARIANAVDIGDGGKEAMTKAVRAHGNFIEYVPLAVITIGLIEMAGGPKWLLHGMGIVLLVARVLHAQGLYQTVGQSFGRLAGTSLTWIVLAVGGIACLYYGFGLQA